VENAIRAKMQGARVENAGLENAGACSRGGKCRSSIAVWKVEPRLYRDTYSLRLLHGNVLRL